MPTVDLPARGITTGSRPATIVGGGGALADPDTSSYAVITYDEQARLDGYSPETIFVGGGDSTSETTFGASDIPYGQVQKIEIVTVAYRDGGGTISPVPNWEANGIEPPGPYYPSLSWYHFGQYDGINGFSDSHNIELPTSWAEATRELLPHEWKYILTTHPDYAAAVPDGYTGLAPRFYPGPAYYWWTPGPPPPPIEIYVAYLALRITYAGGPKRLRKHPISPLRQYPAERYYGRSNRRAGGYL